MAKRVVTRVVVIDDLSGEELAEQDAVTISYYWESRRYEIDLSQQGAKEFRELMEPYVKASRRADRPPRSVPKRSREEMRVIRQWGRDNGFKIESSGRTPFEVIRAYEEAHKVI